MLQALPFLLLGNFYYLSLKKAGLTSSLLLFNTELHINRTRK
ncbi:hypothetical protein HMPREF1044_1004 [Streptococcus constellatus subsp. constellatus SK53]|uniref:Uncharacterized protein n=1 Tax=Streptococcus constellatus subsp. constellatus SK53 TaxID=1095730 RepID=A0AAD2SX23_STRCV|nr:hypothetical protein HMPREF1044_1004 [Streptococcus constellatus subsp. constellatus SK53]BBD22312.1 hypothetical protein SCSC_0633 [Streptococcus constellatus subsp. constellatus]